jgi:hypothetical protein
VGTIRKKADLLDGICSEAIQLLKDKRATAGAIREIRKAKPMRQMEIAELMRASGNYSVGYAKCLIATTPAEELLEPDKTKDVKGMIPEDVARMERETVTLAKEFKLIEESHGRNTLELVLAVGYLKKLLDNARVVRFLSQHHPEILTEFQKLVETKSLRDAG